MLESTRFTVVFVTVLIAPSRMAAQTPRLGLWVGSGNPVWRASVEGEMQRKGSPVPGGLT